MQRISSSVEFLRASNQERFFTAVQDCERCVGRAAAQRISDHTFMTSACWLDIKAAV